MTHDEIIKAWNSQTDKHNQWSDLGEDEMLEFAMHLEREACAKIAEEHQHDCYYGGADWYEARRITAAIRARGEGMNT
jgi:hypothetical protein